MYFFVLEPLILICFQLDAGNPVYFYQFCHRPSEDALIKPPFVKADHGSELGYVLGKPFLAGNVSALAREFLLRPHQSHYY